MLDEPTFIDFFERIENHLMPTLFKADPVHQRLFDDPATWPLKPLGGSVDLLGEFDRNMSGDRARLHAFIVRSQLDFVNPIKSDYGT